MVSSTGGDGGIVPLAGGRVLVALLILGVGAIVMLTIGAGGAIVTSLEVLFVALTNVGVIVPVLLAPLSRDGA